MTSVKYRDNVYKKERNMKKDKTRLDCRKGNKKIQIFLMHARSYTSKFQLILCFNIDLKGLKDSPIFASWGRLFQCKAPL
jgi:hypothetical protein